MISQINLEFSRILILIILITPKTCIFYFWIKLLFCFNIRWRWGLTRDPWPMDGYFVSMFPCPRGPVILWESPRSRTLISNLVPVRRHMTSIGQTIPRILERKFGLWSPENRKMTYYRLFSTVQFASHAICFDLRIPLENTEKLNNVIKIMKNLEGLQITKIAEKFLFRYS